MSIMKLLQLASMTAMFASMVWGVLRFFAAPPRPDVRVRLVAFAAGAGYLNQVAATWQSSAGPGRAAIATTAYLLSAAIFWSAVRVCRGRSLSAIFTADVPQLVVDRGPYRVIRHPFYASYSLFWLAGWIGTGTPLAAIIAAVMATVYARAASLEEARFAASPLAVRYAGYKAATGFFVPRMR
jgi:protein-S-isoprenylcysteine O-methyltransferase Ste14